MVKHLSAMRETWVGSLGGGGRLKRSIPTPVFWPGESPWTGEPGGARVHGVTKSQTRLSD